MRNSPQNFYKKFLGLKGETLAVKTLKKQGYKVVKTNYVTPFGEADIVLEKGGVLYFCEVKTRNSYKYGTPAEAVDSKKQAKYRDIANYYVLQNKLENVNVSFIVVEVLDDTCNVLVDAF